MAQIDISHLTFAYDGSYDNIFEDVSLRLDTDWRLGLTGRNGRGKTTLLRLLMGEYEYRGQISAPVDFAYFPFPVTEPERETLELIQTQCPELELWQLMKEMARLELEEELLYRPFATLSNGERTKLLLAALFQRENAFLLIDEPTDHLDLRGRELVSRWLGTKKGFILVSHDRAFLDGCVDHIMAINRANVTVTKGNFSTWWENKERQDAFELGENEKLKKEIRRLKETVREKAQWSDTAERRKVGVDRTKVDNVKGWAPLQGAKSKKQMARAKAIEARQTRAVEDKEKLLKNIEQSPELKLTSLSHWSRRLVEAKELAPVYGGWPVCAPVSFTLSQGERIALRGKNGAGKSSLLKLICGQPIDYRGRLELAGGLVLSVVPQDASFLRGNLADFARERELDESLFKAILRKLAFSREQFEKDMGAFSAGQKKKVLLAAALCRPAHLYIWDEPLNYIDVLSRMQIEELLSAYEPTMLFVEHDRAFCDKIATSVVEIEAP